MPESFLDLLATWRGERVVVDCKSPFLAVGTLEKATADHLELSNADMHDLRDTETNRELYLVKTARFGIEANRAVLILKMDEIVGVSRLADVIVG